MKTVLINANPALSSNTGIGRYTLEICKRLAGLGDGVEFYFHYGIRQALRTLTPYTKKFHVNTPNRNETSKREKVSSILDGLKSLMPSMSANTSIERAVFSLGAVLAHSKVFDLYFEPNFFFRAGLMARKRIVTIHDLSFLNSEWYWAKGPVARVMRQRIGQSVEKSDCVVVDSEFVKNLLLEHYRTLARPVFVVPLAVDHSTFTVLDKENAASRAAGIGIPDKFILSVGAIQPRKNFEGLIRAYLMLDKEIREEYRLVIAGGNGWANKRVFEAASAAAGRVTILTDVPDSFLPSLYNAASLFVFPSFCEGFGLPPLEAMACGCPVVASNVSSIPEVCGDSALYVDPSSVESIADGITRALTSESTRNFLSSSGISRSKSFNWEKTARSMFEIFHKTI